MKPLLELAARNVGVIRIDHPPLPRYGRGMAGRVMTASAP